MNVKKYVMQRAQNASIHPAIFSLSWFSFHLQEDRAKEYIFA